MCATDCMKGGGHRGRERESKRKEGERNSVLFKWESKAHRGKGTKSEKQQKKWRQVSFTHGKKTET